MKIVMVKLKRINFKLNEAVHTYAYVRDIENWMKQWTVAANFNPICTAVPEAMDFVSTSRLESIEKAAMAKFIAAHIESLNILFPQHTRVDRNYAEDFEFSFELYIANSGEMLETAVPSHNR